MNPIDNKVDNYQHIVEELQAIVEARNEYIANKKKIGFNVFTLFSDTYYKENYHSYIIYHLLNPDSHDKGEHMVNCFIEALKRQENINIYPFQEPIVTREEGRIDVRIRDGKTNRSIIIENKINDAIDMHRQIPTYVKYEEDKGREVVAIVYLTKTYGKTPDKSGWKPQEIDKIKKVFVHMSVTGHEISIIDHWLTPCTENITDVNVKSTITQYASLLHYLTYNTMDEHSMKDFYEYINKNDNFKSVQDIQSMMADLPQYRAIQIKKKYKEDASKIFNKTILFEWGSIYRAKFENTECFDVNFWIDVACEQMKTTLYIAEYPKDSNVDEVIKPFLEKLELSRPFTEKSKNCYETIFEFPNEENELYVFLDELFEKLLDVMPKAKN